jgi:hypothetical protein
MSCTQVGGNYIPMNETSYMYGQGDQIGRIVAVGPLFTLSIFLKISEGVQTLGLLTFFRGKSYVLILRGISK